MLRFKYSKESAQRNLKNYPQAGFELSIATSACALEGVDWAAYSVCFNKPKITRRKSTINLSFTVPYV